MRKLLALIDRDEALPFWTSNDTFGTVDDQRTGGVGRWRRVTQVSADGATALDLCGPDQVHGFDEAGKQPLHLAGDTLLDLTDIIPDFQIPLSKLFE